MRRDAPDTFAIQTVPLAAGRERATSRSVADAADVKRVEAARHGLPADPASVIAALDPLLTPERRARIAHVIAGRTRAIIPVLDGLIDPHNVSAVLRTADAFGVQEIHVIDRGERYMASTRIAQGAERWVDVVHHKTAEGCVEALRRRGHRIYVAALEGAGQTPTPPVEPEALAHEPRAAIVFGNERDGASESLFALADGTYTIPMHGFVQSLNVSVAAAITLFSAMRGRQGDLSEAERELLCARYCVLSVPRADEVVREYLRRRAR